MAEVRFEKLEGYEKKVESVLLCIPLTNHVLILQDRRLGILQSTAKNFLGIISFGVWFKRLSLQAQSHEDRNSSQSHILI